MRIIATIAFYWVGLSAGVAIAIARALRGVPIAAPPPLPDDYLADTPVDRWSDVRVDAEFAAIVAPYEVQS